MRKFYVIFPIVIFFIIVLMYYGFFSDRSTDNRIIADDYKLSGYSDDYKNRFMKATFSRYASGIRVYHYIHGCFPSTNNLLSISLEKGGVFFGHKYKFMLPAKDPWGKKFSYTVCRNYASLISSGIDMKFGTNDDVKLSVNIKNSSGKIIWNTGEDIIWTSSRFDPPPRDKSLKAE